MQAVLRDTRVIAPRDADDTPDASRDNGIVQRAERLARDGDATTRSVVETALKRLIAPSEMGNLFKVLAITDPRLAPPAGFEPRPA